ncbi:tetratricopeptide repeat protein [Duganella sp. HH105]|uniref:tetratricopeptide repeat protein n=1 Tax=Duganella sp. HH105 TaxID=1781067 RepID=UPI000877E124|nr:tetratricopeptide repeat protein [Duganella sp. HH105]
MLILALLVAVPAGAFFTHEYLQERALHALPHGFKKFKLSDPLPSCDQWKHHMPSVRDPSTYRLYIEARQVWRSKIEWQLSHAEADRILKDVSKAAELGDWGARALLAYFYLYGLGVLDSNHVLDAMPEKSVEIARMAAEAGQPWGLYDLGVAYENGYGGVPYDPDLAWAYYLRAAQFGSPDAQMTLAKAYSDAGRLADEATMLQCAFQQGHGPAAFDLAIKAQVEKRFKDAIRLFQEGVKFGSKECAAALELIFSYGHSHGATEEEAAEMKLLGVLTDPERASRYNAIYAALDINPDLRLGKLDEVLPLPPAELRGWSGVEDAVEPEPKGPPTY